MTAAMLRIVACALGVVLAAAGARDAHAYEIYKWVDENGVVHYSESRPEAPATPVEKLHIEATNPPGYDPAEDYWSILNQAERIGAQWSALEVERQEEEARERARATEERLAELEQRVAAAEDAAYSTPLYLPFGRFHRPPFFRRDFPRVPDRPPPRRLEDLPRPGWPGPVVPSAPRTPGFGAPDSRDTRDIHDRR